MKQKHNRFFVRIATLVLAVAMVVISVSANVTTESTSGVSKHADASTMNSWKDYFGEGVTHTQNAGGVWTDKSVLSDASEFPSNTIVMNDEENYLVALSALSASKAIDGTSNAPTDTIFVLDLSGTMIYSDSIEDLVIATNAAIKALYELNLDVCHF